MTNKKLLIGAGILTGAWVLYTMYKKNQEVTEEKSNIMGRRRLMASSSLSKENKILRDSKPVTVIGLPPNPTNLWISSGDPEKCTWYDKNGNATITYNKPCTLAQANMKGGGSPN